MRPVMTAAAALLAVGIAGGAARAEGDAAAGRAIFVRTCANCHSTEIGVNRIGPTLFGVVGRPIASVPDYTYSPALLAMRKDWSVWDATTLDAYLRNPRQVLHGVKMFFKGLPDAADRTAMIAYLATLQ